MTYTTDFPALDRLHRIDRDIIGQLVDNVLARGWMISVLDEEECLVRYSSNKVKIADALAHSEYNRLLIRDMVGTKLGSVLLVYGNEPGVVIADHSDTAAITDILPIIH